MDLQSLLNLDAYNTEVLNLEVPEVRYNPNQSDLEFLSTLTKNTAAAGVPVSRGPQQNGGKEKSAVVVMPESNTTSARRFAPMKERMEYIDMMNEALKLRKQTEGNIATPYQDSSDTIAVGMGLNLSVQDKDSLRRLVGNDPELYAKLSPYVGRQYSSLTDEDKSKLTLTPEQSKALNSYMVSASIDSVMPYSGNLSDTGIIVLSDIQHYTGDRGLRAARSKIGGQTKDGKPVNYVANAVTGGRATDADLRGAIVKTIEDPKVSPVTRARFQKYLSII